MVLHWRGYRSKLFIELQCNLIAGIENYHQATVSIGQFSFRKSTGSSITVLLAGPSVRKPLFYIRTSIHASCNGWVGCSDWGVRWTVRGISRLPPGRLFLSVYPPKRLWNGPISCVWLSSLRIIGTNSTSHYVFMVCNPTVWPLPLPNDELQSFFALTSLLQQ